MWTQQLFLGNKMLLYDIKGNAESDPLRLLPIKVAGMSYCESVFTFDLASIPSYNRACFDST